MKKILKNPERISSIKSVVNKHMWERLNYPSGKDD